MEPSQQNDPTLRTFVDAKGGEWEIELDFGKLRKIKSAAKVDLGNAEKFARVWSELLLDDEKLLNTIYASLDSPGTPDDFASAMNGSTLEAAREALLQAIYFFTLPTKRGMILASAQKMNQEYLRVIAEAEEQIEKATAEAADRATTQLGRVPLRSPAFSDIGTTDGAFAKP